MYFRAAVVARGNDKPDQLLSVNGSQDTIDLAGRVQQARPARWIGLAPSWLSGHKWGTRDLIGKP